MEAKLTKGLQIAISVITLLSLTYFIDTALFDRIIMEDGELENLTALGLLAGSLMLLVRLLKVYRTKNTLWIVVNILMILGLFFGFGEEISWGQRIFGVESNEFFSQNNAQNETNLHNLKVGDVKVNRILSLVLSIGFGFYYLFMLLLYKKVNIIQNLINTLGIPLPTLKQSIWFLAATGIILIVPSSKKWEIWECVFVLSFLWILIAPYNIGEKLFIWKK